MPDSPMPPDPAAPQTAARLSATIRAIDDEFGAGFARQHPELVAALVQSASIDAAVATGLMAHREALALADRIGRDTCETLLKLKPRFFG
ncbi:hypothetical protein EI983_11335 [Roseovarius faecimaris]|uniref:Uncharacterized protein n=1 Tax=Roseovarius faecimaris TaxID=2494550 RepID=A0A6I6IRH9_9RHOB|nr:hypothetical protein [Roseovarius faecimaris]QGX98832.1 hypothetical protein EI983_11335 [Roseovarius faecimaris]